MWVYKQQELIPQYTPQSMLYGTSPAHVDTIQYQPAIISAMMDGKYEVAETLAWQFMKTLSNSKDTRTKYDNATELLQAARYIHASKLNENIANQNFSENSRDLAIFCMNRAITCQGLYDQVVARYNDNTTEFYLQQKVPTRSLQNRLQKMKNCSLDQPHRPNYGSKVRLDYAAQAQAWRGRENSGFSESQLDTKQQWEAAVIFAMNQQKYDEAEMLALKLVNSTKQNCTGTCSQINYATVLLQAVRYIHVSKIYERIAYQEFLRNNFALAAVCIRNTISYIQFYNKCAERYSKATTHFTLQQSAQIASFEKISHEISTYESGHDSMVLAKQQYKCEQYAEADANVTLARKQYNLGNYPLLQKQYPEPMFKSLLASKCRELESIVLWAEENMQMLHLRDVYEDHRPDYGEE